MTDQQDPSDQAIDEAARQMMASEPSPGFTAEVLARVHRPADSLRQGYGGPPKLQRRRKLHAKAKAGHYGKLRFGGWRLPRVVSGFSRTAGWRVAIAAAIAIVLALGITLSRLTVEQSTPAETPDLTTSAVPGENPVRAAEGSRGAETGEPAPVPAVGQVEARPRTPEPPRVAALEERPIVFESIEPQPMEVFELDISELEIAPLVIEPLEMVELEESL